MSTKSTVSAIFPNPNSANQVILQLQNGGFTRSSISVVMAKTSDTESLYRTADDTEETHAAEGGFAGAAIGGALGAVAAGLTAVGAVVIPGAGLLVSGPLAAALAGAGAGGAAGGLIGSLVGFGIPENEAKLYQENLERGSVLVTVKTESPEQEKRVAEIFEQFETVKSAA